MNNPSIEFYNTYEEEILTTRNSLYTELETSSPYFAVEAKELLDKKLQSNSGKPLLGELFPWIIKDLINADDDTTKKISTGWLAMYLYTLFLDEHVDNPKPINSTKFITGSLLAKTGLLQLSRYTINTPYEAYLEKALSFSAKNQELDVTFKSQKSSIDFKESYSKGKNYVLLACAGALAAQNSQHAQFITEFTENLLLTLQYLDDIADYNQDFKENNFTVLLSEAFKEKDTSYEAMKQMSQEELLGELIHTGALERVVKKVVTLLDQSFVLINSSMIEKETHSAALFHSLRSHCLKLIGTLELYQGTFGTISVHEQSVVLGKVKRQITIIAQST